MSTSTQLHYPHHPHSAASATTAAHVEVVVAVSVKVIVQ